MLKYFTAVVAAAKSTDSPPDVTFIGNAVALSYGVVPHPFAVVVHPTPVTLPESCMLLPDSSNPEMIVVFAFCEVVNPMLSTTNAKAAATITKAIITIADSTPMTPR